MYSITPTGGYRKGLLYVYTLSPLLSCAVSSSSQSLTQAQYTRTSFGIRPSYPRSMLNSALRRCQLQVQIYPAVRAFPATVGFIAICPYVRMSVCPYGENDTARGG